MSVIVYFNKVVNPVIFHMSETKVRSFTSKEINNAVFESVGNAVIYDMLIMITRNEAGDIVLIQSNAVQINHLAREVSMSAQCRLEKMGVDGIEVPLGSFSGMPIFAGRGPAIKIKLLPVGSVNCSFSSEFLSKGINQTNHRIYLNVNANIGIVLPMENKNVLFSTQILISESIIVGKVPDTYLSSNSLDEMLNLVPSN